jgi:hypothetical protein
MYLHNVRIGYWRFTIKHKHGLLLDEMKAVTEPQLKSLPKLINGMDWCLS